MISPAFKHVVGGKNHFIGEKPNPNGMAPKLMTGPILPFVVSKNLFTPTVISEDVPMKMEKVMSGPIYQGKANDPYNEYNEIAARKPHEAPMVGPIYPNIDTCNQFNPKQERVTGLLETAGPVYPVEVHNVYGPIPKREHEGEMMVGPVYHGIDTKNSFVPPKEKGHGEIANCGPIRRNVEHESKFTPEILKAETEIARCGPVYHGIEAGKSNKYLPPVDIKETEKTFKAPIYKGIEVKSKYFPQADEKPKLDSGLLGPKYKVDSVSDYNPEHEVSGRKPHEPPMVGPIYPNIDTCNQYNPKEDRVRGPVELSGPVYHGLEVKNEYGPVLKREHEGEMMVGPVYHGIDTKNSFVPPKEKGYGEIANCGPIRKHVEHESKFTPEILKAETEIARCGPVYHGIDAGKSNKYLPPVDIKETEKTFKAPIYKGIEVKSKYFPQAEEKPKVDAGLLGPKYQVDSVSDYHPEHEISGRKPHEPPMVGPIYPNIDTCNQYNPKEDRVRGPVELSGPVYHGLETKNVYGPVLKREHEGELMVGPVYHGIETKNVFVPPKEKGHGEIANCGPVRKHVDDTIKYTPEIDKKEGEIARCGPVYHGIDAGKSNKYCPQKARIPGELAPAYPVLNVQDMPKGMYCPSGIETSKRVDNGLPLEGPLYFNKHNKHLQSDI